MWPSCKQSKSNERFLRSNYITHKHNTKLIATYRPGDRDTKY